MTLRDLRQVAVDATASEAAARERLLQLVDAGPIPGDLVPVVDSLFCRLGLFPYMRTERPSLGEHVIKEAHRLEGPLERIVLHQEQAHVFGLLVDGRNVILSAPTSFGKSLLIDAVLGSGKYARVAIVIPTIALMDETRRRLEKFSSRFQLITSSLQARTRDHVVYILTPERVLERKDLHDIEFFVIDEFYKMSPREAEDDEDFDDDRQVRLNQAFARLFKTGAKFYMLGPNIKQLSASPERRLDAELVITEFKTVASKQTRIVCRPKERFDHLVRILNEHDGQTLVYCRSPASAREVAERLAGVQAWGGDEALLTSAAKWCRENVHPQWSLPTCLERGIAIHHGKMQRSLGQAMVRLFNQEKVRVLVCTSTLIEGVNTSARNIVVYDNQVALRKIDYFTFNNILGRSGRMFKHAVGHAFTFHDPPENQLPIVELPAATPTPETPLDILLDIDPARLDEPTREVVQSALEEAGLDSGEPLQANPYLRPTEQIKLRRWIDRNPRRLKALLESPTVQFPELKEVFTILHEEAGVALPKAALSPAQLGFYANFLSSAPDYPALAERLMNAPNVNGDLQKAIDKSFEVVRDVGEYGGSRMLRGFAHAVETENAAYSALAKRLKAFAVRIETRGYSAELYALEEYGIPVQISLRHLRSARVSGDLDATHAKARALAGRLAGLSPFEKFLLERAD